MIPSLVEKQANSSGREVGANRSIRGRRVAAAIGLDALIQGFDTGRRVTCGLKVLVAEYPHRCALLSPSLSPLSERFLDQTNGDHSLERHTLRQMPGRELFPDRSLDVVGAHPRIGTVRGNLEVVGLGGQLCRNVELPG